jgi:SAM-dependent methyltransferase
MPKLELYDQIWTHEEYRSLSIEESLAERILRICREKGFRRVLSIGCGQGQAVRRFLQEGMDAYGVDCSANALAACADLGNRVLKADAVSLGAEQFGKVDLVCCVDMLQCVEPSNLPALLDALRRQGAQQYYFLVRLGDDFLGPKLIGAGLHACVRSSAWWELVLAQYFRLHKPSLVEVGPLRLLEVVATNATDGQPRFARNASPDEPPEARHKRLRRLAEILSARRMVQDMGELECPESDYAAAGLRIGFTPSGLPAGFLKVGNRELPIDDVTDPQAEAERWALTLKIQSDNTLVFMVGFGMGYAAEAVLALLGSRSKLLVVEPYLPLLRAACEYRDLRRLFADSRFVLYAGDDINTVKALVERLKSEDTVTLTAICPSVRPAHSALLGQTTVDLAEAATFRFNTCCLTARTVNADGLTWNEFHLRNISWMLDKAGIEALGGEPTPPAAVIVGAGPTLEHSLDFVREMQKRVPVFSAEVALPRLKAAGIDPHMVVALDRNILSVEKSRLADPTKTGLLLAQQVHPEYRDLPALFKLANLDADYCNLLSRVYRRDYTPVMGFVGAMAVMAAVAAGARKLYLTGMDFAFAPDGCTHVKDAIPDHFTAEVQRAEWLSVPGYETESLRTNVQLHAYLEVFCDYLRFVPEVTFIPVTSGGARIGDLAHVRPEEAMRFTEEYPPFDWATEYHRRVLVQESRLNAVEQRRLLQGAAREFNTRHKAIREAKTSREVWQAFEKFVASDALILCHMAFRDVVDQVKDSERFGPDLIHMIRERMDAISTHVQPLLQDQP